MAKTREEILALGKREFTEVHGVRLQSLNELEASSLESIWHKRFEETEEVDMSMRRELLTFAIVDGDGNRLFKFEDAELLGQLPPDVIADCYAEARRLSKMDVRTKAVDQLEKKSQETAA